MIQYQLVLVMVMVHFLAGLLAGLWEFPSLLLESGQEKRQKAALADHLQAWVGSNVATRRLQHVGEVHWTPLPAELAHCLYSVSPASASPLATTSPCIGFTTYKLGWH